LIQHLVQQTHQRRKLQHIADDTEIITAVIDLSKPDSDCILNHHSIVRNGRVGNVEH